MIKSQIEEDIGKIEKEIYLKNSFPQIDYREEVEKLQKRLKDLRGLLEEFDK